MRDYQDFLALAKEPHPFDNVKYATPELMKLVSEVLVPYASGVDKASCLSRVADSSVEAPDLAVLYMLSLMKRDGYTYSPALIPEYAQGIADFIQVRAARTNALTREATRLVGALHGEALTTVMPHEFVLTLVSDLQGHQGCAVSYKDVFLPQVWAPDAMGDPALEYMGLALEQILLCYPEKMGDVQDDRLESALKHYAPRILKTIIKQPKHRDQMFSVELGL